jgi:glutamate carboxypeptidase
MNCLLRRMSDALPAMLDDTETLVRCESPSADLAAVARSAEVVGRVGAARLGVPPEVVVLAGRTHLRWRFGSGPARVLLLGHHDTVWPLGSLAAHPAGVRDGVLRGPGCFDMKAGLAMAFHAVAALPDRDGVAILVTGDEELGSPSSRELVQTAAAGCAAALVLEASAAGGALKTARSGVSLYQVLVTGRAAHAGLEPEAGVNAAVEAAHQVLAAAALAAPAAGTTVTPSVLSAGATSNTVPAEGAFTLDVRARSAAEQRRVHEALLGLRPILPGAQVSVRGGPNRPPLEATAAAELFVRAQRLAAGLGLAPLLAAEVGGASDGNLTAGAGTPTLDGLGAVGGGAHADSEHVLVAELPGRTALLAALVADLLAGQPAPAAPDVARP